MSTSDDRLVDLVEGLYAATIEKNMAWSESADEGKFQCRLGGVVVGIFKMFEDGPDEFYTQIELRNLEGTILEEIWPGMIPGDESPKFGLKWYAVMDDLYNRARRQALGVEEAIDSILAVLSKKRT